MKAIALCFLVLGVVSHCTAIPLENPSEAPEDSKHLESQSQVRQKRGWGYETAWVPSHGPAFISTSPVLGPSRTVIHSPTTVAVAPSTTLVAAAPAAVAVPSGHHSESFVYSSGPDHTYYVHQKHHPRTYYYTYPSGYYHSGYYPSTHYVASAPVITTWP